MTAWQVNKNWSDKFADAICSQISESLGISLGEVSVAPEEDDQKMATDFFAGTKRVAARIRQADLADKYGDEFTIRYSHPSGARTEYYKIMHGLGDYLFYGFGDDGGELVRWFLGDLAVFRTTCWEWIRQYNGIMAEDKGNPGVNGGQRFWVFHIGNFPDDFIVDSSWCTCRD